jgi:hypothetical protein
MSAALHVVLLLVIIAVVVPTDASDGQRRRHEGGDDVDAALLHAVQAGDLSAARRLRGAGASLRPEVANFLLCESAYNGAAEMAKLLLAAGADVTHTDATQAGADRTPLHYVRPLAR